MRVSVTPRRPLYEVLGRDTGPSPRGSTYWTRALSCPREHLLANVLGYRPVQLTDPLMMGLLWHDMLEAYYRRIEEWQTQCRADEPEIDRRGAHYLWGGLDHAHRAALESLSRIAGEPGYEKAHTTLSRMFEVYTLTYRDPWEIVAVEVSASGLLDPQRPGTEYTARLDLAVYDYSLLQPVLRIIEHKSASWLSFDLVEGYTMDLQVMGQIWLAQQLVAGGCSTPFDGVTVSITTKASTPACERVPVRPSEALVEAWRTAMLDQIAVVDTYAERGYPRNYAHCVRRYGRCEFFGLCSAYPDVPVSALTADDVPPGYRGRACP